jgi:hypothetical protein
MAETYEMKQIDKRVVARYVRRGVVDEKEYAAFLKSLPDLADQCVAIEAFLEGDEVDDFDAAG